MGLPACFLEKRGTGQNRTGRLDFTDEGGTETNKQISVMMCSPEHIITEICLGQSLIFHVCVCVCVISINEESVIVCNK